MIPSKHKGFSLVELLIVIFVLAILALLVAVYIPGAQERAYLGRANTEFNTFVDALKLYSVKYNDFPADVSRGLPASLNEFIATSSTNPTWPTAPWPASVYDYDRWPIDDGTGTLVDTIQISIRFCPAGGPLSACKFPNEPWAKNFDINSAYYYCMQGLCRSHQSSPAAYPGYCVNCPGNKAIGT